MHINDNLTTMLLYTHTCGNIKIYVLESDNLDSDLTRGSKIEKLVKTGLMIFGLLQLLVGKYIEVIHMV